MPETLMLRCTRLLLVALLVAALINVAILLGGVLDGLTWNEAEATSGWLLSWRLFDPTGIDSWRTMVAAFEHNQAHPGELYWVFLVKGIKFQYPPSSLLVLPLLPLPIGPEFRAKMALPSGLAVWCTILCSVYLAMRLSSRPPEYKINWRDPLVLCGGLLFGTLGWTYYPLGQGHMLGQIQVFLGALVALSLVFKALGWQTWSGACIGLCCLAKPQYAILALWALLRREVRFLIGLCAVAAIGLAASLWMFGLDNHLQYLEVLKRLSQGEAYGPNQSVNGLLQRFLENGNAIKFQSRALPPYHPVVYYCTLISSALLLGAALFWPMAREARGKPIDLALALCASTMASPIAWEHHYGAFLPAFAIALPAALPSLRWSILWLIGYQLVASEFVRRPVLFADRWRGILGSHIFFGAVLLFVLLLVLRRQPLTAAFAGADQKSM